MGNIITVTGMLAALTGNTTRRVTEVGLLVGGIGCLALVIGGVVALVRRDNPQHAAPWIWVVVGAVLIGVGFGTQLYALHYGR